MINLKIVPQVLKKTGLSIAPDADPMWLLNPQPLWSPDEIAKATGGEWISGKSLSSKKPKTLGKIIP
jgi:hypothetical protein